MQFITANLGWLLLLLILLVCFLMLVFLAKPIMRYIIKIVVNNIMTRLLKDKYGQNLFELFPALKRFSVLNAVELSLRAQSGRVLKRPLGSPKQFLGFENLMFTPRMMTGFSLPESTYVDMSVTIGKCAEKPLTISIPLMISGMSYGLGLSEGAKRALAKAAKTLQTAICSGEGPLLPEEREEADKYVLQISRWPWGGRTSEQIATANMLEVQMGRGSDMGPVRIEANDLEGRARILGGLATGQPAISLPAPPGVQRCEDWPGFMKDLRQKANGIPIALKLMATDHLEEDLSVAVNLGFDAVVIDGGEGGCESAAPIKQDDFGLPSLYALVRARRYLKDRPISLIVSGGYFTPGQCLKALALGADAIYLGTVPLIALVHNQFDKVTPWEPSNTLVFYDSPAKSKLDIELAATNVVNTLTAMMEELQEAMRAMGKASLKELGPDDLVALDVGTSEVTGIKLVYDDSQIPQRAKVPLEQKGNDLRSQPLIVQEVKNSKIKITRAKKLLQTQKLT